MIKGHRNFRFSIGILRLDGKRLDGWGIICRIFTTFDLFCERSKHPVPNYSFGGCPFYPHHVRGLTYLNRQQNHPVLSPSQRHSYFASVCHGILRTNEECLKRCSGLATTAYRSIHEESISIIHCFFKCMVICYGPYECCTWLLEISYFTDWKSGALTILNKVHLMLYKM